MTGASGRVGTALRPYLRAAFQLRLLDRARPAEPPAPNEEVVTADLADRLAVEAAMQDVDAVLHLACVHGLELTFEASLDSNYRALLGLLEASIANDVGRFVYASSHHVLGAYRREASHAARDVLAPDGFYGLSKAFGEAACAMYAHRFGLPTLVIRIGNADPAVADDRSLRMWTSARDLAALIGIGLQHQALAFEVVYGASQCPAPKFDNARAYALGYRPRDKALDNLAPGFRPYASMPPALGPEWVGGAYAVAPLPAVAPAADRAADGGPEEPDPEQPGPEEPDP